MNELFDCLQAWQKADAVTLYGGSLMTWTDERARGLYMRALIPVWEGSTK